MKVLKVMLCIAPKRDDVFEVPYTEVADEVRQRLLEAFPETDGVSNRISIELVEIL